MVEWENRGENAAAASAAENQTLIPLPFARVFKLCSGEAQQAPSRELLFVSQALKRPNVFLKKFLSARDQLYLGIKDKKG